MNRLQFVFGLSLAATAVNSTAPATDVVTNRGTSARTGLNSTETILNPSNLGSPAFGLLYHEPVDGEVSAQRLYVPQQRITPTGGQPRVANVSYVATKHDSLYCFAGYAGDKHWQHRIVRSSES